ncbi:hypothetical protein VNO77_24037 [Canavalia gladiata]|uniref:Uncharacterized protein n=1 Tax=Canavalia gladiata TaxID=3824 RepID=A0AAN9QC40_CANGL
MPLSSLKHEINDRGESNGYNTICDMTITGSFQLVATIGFLLIKSCITKNGLGPETRIQHPVQCLLSPKSNLSLKDSSHYKNITAECLKFLYDH